jgi:hypothetical protein
MVFLGDQNKEKPKGPMILLGNNRIKELPVINKA